MTGADQGRRARGFTLVEVLVALAILAGVVGGILSLIGANTRFTASVEEKLLAEIVAENLMVDAMSTLAPLAEGQTAGVSDLADRQWFWTQTITPVGVASVVRIDIVIRARENGQVLFALETLKGTSA